MSMARMALVLLVTSAIGCGTTFTGSAHVEDGRRGCETKCRGQGMQVAGMVYMGEYSSACVCQVPRGTASNADDSTQLLSSAAAVTGAADGVVMEAQRRAAQQQSHH
jgi:hypothetical protein